MSTGRRLDQDQLGDSLDRLYRAAWALCGCREDAEDLVQDTYVRVMARPRFLRNEDELGYLLRALRNTFLSRRRKALRRQRPEAIAAEPEQVQDRNSPSPDEVVEARQVYAAIAALPSHCRDVLVAVDIAGLSYDEAARALRLRKGTVTSRLFRARQQVIRRLEGTWPDAEGVRETPRRERAWSPARFEGA